MDAGMVLPRVAQAGERTRRKFLARMLELIENPLPGDGDILPLQDPTRPNGYTASFGDGLVLYQVMKDQPLVKLIDVLWL